jgi:hypothetical protein
MPMTAIAERGAVPLSGFVTGVSMTDRLQIPRP